MLQSGQNWDLFGYDVRQLLKHWRSAWREFLWGYDSPVKARFDEVLRVKSEHGLAYYHAGHRVNNPQQEQAQPCEAVLLPDEMVLIKTLVLPLAVESDLDSVMALEVMANSPFPDNDTGSGWRLLSRNKEHLSVELAIVSLSSVMSYLGQQYDCHDSRAQEVWANVGEAVIVLTGFGEQRRLQRYNKRLIKVASGIAYCAVLLIVIFAIAAGSKYFHLQQLRSLSAQMHSQAGQAIKMRSSIVESHEAIAAVNSMLEQRPNPHFELARLTHMLGDDASLLQFSIQGTDLDIRGVADDASVVVQQLTNEPSYAQVTAPQAITKYFNTGQEQFFLNIKLAGSQDVNSEPAAAKLAVEAPE